jgi:hypothetical protein
MASCMPRSAPSTPLIHPPTSQPEHRPIGPRTTLLSSNRVRYRVANRYQHVHETLCRRLASCYFVASFQPLFLFFTILAPTTASLSLSIGSCRKGILQLGKCLSQCPAISQVTARKHGSVLTPWPLRLLILVHPLHARISPIFRQSTNMLCLLRNTRLAPTVSLPGRRRRSWVVLIQTHPALSNKRSWPQNGK